MTAAAAGTTSSRSPGPSRTPPRASRGPGQLRAEQVQPPESRPCVGQGPQLADRTGELDRVLVRRRRPGVLGLVGAPEPDVHAVPRQQPGVVTGERVGLREPGLHLRVAAPHGLHDPELVSGLGGHLGHPVLGGHLERLVEKSDGLLVRAAHPVHEDGPEGRLRPGRDPRPVDPPRSPPPAAAPPPPARRRPPGQPPARGSIAASTAERLGGSRATGAERNGATSAGEGSRPSRDGTAPDCVRPAPRPLGGHRRPPSPGRAARGRDSSSGSWATTRTAASTAPTASPRANRSCPAACSSAAVAAEIRRRSLTATARRLARCGAPAPRAGCRRTTATRWPRSRILPSRRRRRRRCRRRAPTGPGPRTGTRRAPTPA